MSNMNDVIGLRVPYSKAGSQYFTEFEPATGTVWGYFNPKHGVPCYSLGLLKDILEHDQHLMRNGGKVEVDGALHQVNHYVTASRIPGVFNVGGDLALFAMLIKSGDREALAQYAKLCIDNIFPRTQSFFSPGLPFTSGISARPASTQAMPIGLLMRKIGRQSRPQRLAWMSRPPVTGPATEARPAVRPKSEKATARSLGGNMICASASTCGIMTAPATP